MLQLNNGELSVSNPTLLPPLRVKFDLKNILASDARVEEISMVSYTKAPELLSLFSIALRDLSNHLGNLHYLSAIASKKVRERKAVVVVEVIPGKLAEKKMTNNDTNREAIVTMDPEYSALVDIELEIEAAFVFIKNKLETTESHLNAVKKALESVVLAARPSLATHIGTLPETETVNGMQIGKTRY